MSCFQARDNKNLKKTMFSELPKLEEAIESKQFVAHANSILDTEMATEKVVTGRSYYVLYLHFTFRWQTWN